MLEILIGGKPLWIAEGTAITMEQSSSLFDIDNMCSEVVWTFDVPAGRNAELLGQVHYTVVGAYRSYGCQLRYDGVLFGSGRLYVQVVTDEETVSCGVVVSDVAEGWGERLLRDDEGWERREIATSLEEHEAGWEEFLRSTLAEGSDVKFFLFADDEFTDRENYGYHLGRLSHLQESEAANLFAKWINRLLTDGGGGIVNLDDERLQGARIFNRERSGVKSGGYHFCPALRLEGMVRTAMADAGYSVTGNFLTDARVRRLFHQSLNAMDGDIRQYEISAFFDVAGATQGYRNPDTPNAVTVTINGGEFNNFLLTPSTSMSQGIRLRLWLSDWETLARNRQNTESGALLLGFDCYDEAYYLIVSPTTYPVSAGGAFFLWYTTGGVPIVLQGGENYAYEGVQSSPIKLYGYTWMQDVHAYPLTYTMNNAGLDYRGWIDTTMEAIGLSLSSGGRYKIEIVKVKVRTSLKWFSLEYSSIPANLEGFNLSGETFWGNDRARLEWITIESVYNTEVDTGANMGIDDYSKNIYQKYYDAAEHVPDLSNSDFLKTMARTFGLAVWFSPFGKRVEMSFFADMVDAKALDVTEWVVGEKKEAYAEGHYEVVLPTVMAQKEIDGRLVMEPVVARGDLTLARMEKNRQGLVRAENCHMRSVKDSTTNQYVWEHSRGNDARLVVGDEAADMTEVKPDVEVVNMRVVDTMGTAKYVMEVPKKGASPLYDDDYTGKQRLTLTQYRGRRLLGLQAADDGVRQAWIEDANPTCYNADGSVEDGMITLAAAGERSVGELWLRELYDFLAHKETFELVLRLPVTAFLRLHRLMEPQDGDPREQERWIYYKGRRFLPSRISYQFRSGLVEATVTCHRRHLGE